jgi:CRISPR/Cas system-associated protein Csx1
MQELMIGTFMDEEHSAIGEQIGVERSWIVEEIGESEVVLLCNEALNYMGQLLAEAKVLFGKEAKYENIEIDLSSIQVLLETDIDPSLIEKWNW